MDWIYIATAIVAVIVTGIAAFMVQVPSKIRWFRRGFFLLVAAAFLIASIAMPLNTHAKVTGYFIAVLMACFGLWRQGLTNWGIIAGLGATRVWGTITTVELTHDDKHDVTVLEAFVGSIRVSRLRFSQSQAALGEFIKNKAPNTKLQ